MNWHPYLSSVTASPKIIPSLSSSFLWILVSEDAFVKNKANTRKPLCVVKQLHNSYQL